MRKRLRDYGLSVGSLQPGAWNAITDVEGVRVGHTTLVSGEGALHPGEGPVRTGVTVILPHGGSIYREKVHAAVHTINGYGKPLGFEQVRELGLIESPIALTNTLNVGLVADALVQALVADNPDIGIDAPSVNVLVGETNDGYLNDLQGRHVKAGHVFSALKGARPGPVAEGALGAGTGVTCFGWKGGIGTASRVLSIEQGGYTLGALVQTNFGSSRDFVICGHPVGMKLQPPAAKPLPLQDGGGSVMVVLATDAPLVARQLQRVAVRAGAGLARTGSIYSHGSGDFVIAFSTANRMPVDSTRTLQQEYIADEEAVLNPLFHAAADCVEEAVLNSLFMAETVSGRDGHIRHALPVEEVLRLMQS